MMCPKAVIDCPQGCSEKIERGNLEEHGKTCSREVVTCIFSQHGCREKVERRDMENHVVSLFHIQLLLQQNAVLQRQIDSISSSIGYRYYLSKDKLFVVYYSGVGFALPEKSNGEIEVSDNGSDYSVWQSSPYKGNNGMWHVEGTPILLPPDNYGNWSCSRTDEFTFTNKKSPPNYSVVIKGNFFYRKIYNSMYQIPTGTLL